MEAELSAAAARLLLAGSSPRDAAAEDLPAGQRLYAFYGCAACHDEGLTGATLDQLAAALAEVPEMAGIELGQSDIAALTAYLNTGAGP